MNIDSKLLRIQEINSKLDLDSVNKYKQIATILFEKEGKKTIIKNWQIDWMKELRTQNKSYEDIAKILGLSLSSIRYYLVAGEKDKMKIANEKNRKKMQSNPSVWNAYKDYQREYQRKLAQKRKLQQENLSAEVLINNVNENENKINEIQNENGNNN